MHKVLAQIFYEGGSGPGSEANRQLQAAAGMQGGNLGAPVDPRLIVAQIIYVALGLLGTIFIVLTVYAGFLWMTAGGNEDNIAKAKKILMASVIGLAIILVSYSITWFVFNAITGATSSFLFF
ncbi:MAG: hypothetical protein WC526_00255 [Patescibacteria group bacterium]